MNDADKRLKIAFLTSFDPLDRRSWSGTVYHLAQALQKHCGELSYIGPMKIREKTIGKVINKYKRSYVHVIELHRVIQFFQEPHILDYGS